MSGEPIWHDQLEAHIRNEGGRWDSTRMRKACAAAGHHVTVQHPELLAKAEGTRWSYDTVPPTA